MTTEAYLLENFGGIVPDPDHPGGSVTAAPGFTTIAQRDGMMVYDEGRPCTGPAFWKTKAQAETFMDFAGEWPGRIVRFVNAGDVVPMHHHRHAYWGYAAD